MTSRFANRAAGVAAATAIVLLVLLIVLLWTGVRQDFFQSGEKRKRNSVNGTEFRIADDDGFPTGSDYIRKDESRTKERSSGGMREYVRPMKISPLGLSEQDLLYGRDQLQDGDTEPVQLRHHSGHYRHRTANIWDPHPIYEFTAFQRNFLLVLEHDSGFASPDLKVTHIWHNTSTRRLPNIKSNGCFYKGYVKGDPASSVAVSLCHGMTGNIRTSTGNYFIEPFEVTPDHAKPMEHVIYEMARTGKNGVDLNHCGLDDYESLKFHMKKATSDARTKKEPVMLFDYETGDHHHNHHFDGEEQEDYGSGQHHRSYKRKRSKRSTRGKDEEEDEYYVEMLVVADSSMANYHGNNTENYILALMYIVSGIFKDASIGNPITIAVVKLQIHHNLSYVKHRYYDHNGVSAAEMLRAFCHEQARNNTKDEDSEYHHDTALLLTRENICRNASAQKCETLGLAELGTMCDEGSSCSLVQDNGLSAAFTIAHELGHVFNMPHDDAEIKCRNHASRDSVSHVMSTSLKEGTNPWSWSECSRHFITEFLESRHSSCLRDKPVEDIIKKVPQGYFPGETIVGNRQCELLYGEGSRICSFMPVCSALWCSKLDSDGCQTLHMPWGDGTPCAEGAWCQKGVCVEKNRKALEKVNGGWGPWEEFGRCSRTCGGGVMKAVRYCNNPVPQNGGKYCVGVRVKYKSCSTEDCPDPSKDFRQEQCSSFDNNNHNIHGIPVSVKWVPKYGLLDDDRCVLYCRPEKGTLYYPLQDKVIDGTPCSPDSYDICVNGQCKPAGCDHVLYSKAKPDLCGKCEGSNNTCHLIREVFNERAVEDGYRHVVTIPAGSSNLDIRQFGINGERDENFLALRTEGTSEGKLLNNDHVLTTFPKIIKYFGVILQYSGCLTGVERINATRPLPRDLIVEVLSAGNLTPPFISYQYTVPINYGYVWKHMDKEWEQCDRVCKGRAKRKLRCVQIRTNQVDDDHFCSNVKRPPPIYDTCNNECTLKWHVTRSPCSNNCGHGTRYLLKQCIQEFDDTGEIHQVHNSSCAHLIDDLPDVEECVGLCGSFDWEYGDWDQCSKTCGTGIRRRAAVCMDRINDIYVADENCDFETKVVEENCSIQSCSHWKFSTWSKCSVSCGKGIRTRTKWCQSGDETVNEIFCDANTKPKIEEPCTSRCFFWSMSEWSKCSVTCGEGMRKRTTVCRNHEQDIVPDSLCKQSERPRDKLESCSAEPCPRVRNSEDNRIPVKVNHRGSGSYGRPKFFHWSIVRNENCIGTCGTGIKEHLVRCLTSLNRTVDPRKCDPSKRPNSTEVCELKPCPKAEWVKGDWSPCTTSCGKGKQQRQVLCRRLDGKILEDRDCVHLGPKPEVEKECVRQCRTSKYKWKYGPWSTCSATCGYGEKIRNVKCMNVTMESNEVRQKERGGRLRSFQEVDKSYCHSKNRRKDRKKCRRKYCPYTWVEGDWSECSKKCGRGNQSRNVTCHKVNAYDWLDPTPLENETVCSSSSRPSTIRNCLVRDCNSLFYWSPEEWQECTTPCGRKGTQRRAYKCRGRDGTIQDKINCFGLNKPLPKSRPCNRRPCHPISCKDIQLHTHDRADGEYMMLVGGRNMSIYCKGMNTGSPEEYLTLHYPDNYSEFTDERLTNQTSCVKESGRSGTRTDNCNCHIENRYGLTRFKKVRLLVESLHIQTDDFTFSESSGRHIPLGEAGGCCCKRSCTKKGSFGINLIGTSLEVSMPISRWVRKTSDTELSYSSEEFRISGECGGTGKYGSCGSCGPSPSRLLKLHVVPP